MNHEEHYHCDTCGIKINDVCELREPEWGHGIPDTDLCDDCFRDLEQIVDQAETQAVMDFISDKSDPEED